MNKKQKIAIYGKDWDLIARGVKFRAGYKCQICKRGYEKNKGIRLTVHHRDGNPRNHSQSNLLCLCNHCHLIEQMKLQPKYKYDSPEENLKIL